LSVVEFDKFDEFDFKDETKTDCNLPLKGESTYTDPTVPELSGEESVNVWLSSYENSIVFTLENAVRDRD